jgi:hypothetical protein
MSPLMFSLAVANPCWSDGTFHNVLDGDFAESTYRSPQRSAGHAVRAYRTTVKSSERR